MKQELRLVMMMYTLKNIYQTQGIVIEVHITNIHAREEFRHHSFISKVAQGIIAGFGEESYLMAIDYLYKLNNKKA